MSPEKKRTEVPRSSKAGPPAGEQSPSVGARPEAARAEKVAAPQPARSAGNASFWEHLVNLLEELAFWKRRRPKVEPEAHPRHPQAAWSSGSGNGHGGYGAADGAAGPRRAAVDVGRTPTDVLSTTRPIDTLDSPVADDVLGITKGTKDQSAETARRTAPPLTGRQEAKAGPEKSPVPTPGAPPKSPVPVKATPDGRKPDPAAPLKDKGAGPVQKDVSVAGPVTAGLKTDEPPPTTQSEPPALPGESEPSGEGVVLRELGRLSEWCKQQEIAIKQVGQKVQEDEAAWKDVAAGVDKRLGDLEGRLASIEKQVQDVGPKLDALRDQANKWASAARHDAEAGVRKRVEEVLTQGARRMIQVMLEETPSGSAANRADPPGSAASANTPGLAPVAALNRSELAENASLEENKGLEKDQKELDDFQRQARHWAGQIVKLREELTGAATAFAEKLLACRKVRESLPAQPQENLKSWQEGLDLVGKMMDQSLARLPAEEKFQEGPLSACGPQGWVDFLVSESSERAAKRKIDAQLKQLGDARYQRVTEARNAANGGRDSFKRFLEKQVLVVLDAIDDGQHYAGPVIPQLKEANPAEADNLETWYATYEGLRQELLGRLETLGVRPMQVQRGDPVDYNRHEPVDVEKDADLPNERIKAVTRNGYDYVVEKDGEPLVLRSAQVVVAKN